MLVNKAVQLSKSPFAKKNKIYIYIYIYILEKVVKILSQSWCDLAIVAISSVGSMQVSSSRIYESVYNYIGTCVPTEVCTSLNYLLYTITRTPLSNS